MSISLSNSNSIPILSEYQVALRNNQAINRNDHLAIVHIKGENDSHFVSSREMISFQALDIIFDTVKAVPTYIAQSIVNNTPQETRERLDPQYQDQYKKAYFLSGIATAFLGYIADYSLIAATGYAAYYLTQSLPLAFISSGAITSTLYFYGVFSGSLGEIIIKAYYSTFDLQVRAINFIYDHGLSLHWHSLMLNARSLWGSVTADDLNKISEDRHVHIHPRIIKRLSIEEFHNLAPRIINKFRDDQKLDINEHFSKLERRTFKFDHVLQP